MGRSEHQNGAGNPRHLRPAQHDREARTGRASFRIREVSQTDLEQSSQLAKEIEAREALATQVEELVKTNAVQLGILSRLDKVTQNPLVKVVLTMLATAVLTWLAARGIKVPQ